MKTCSECGMLKPLESFYVKKSACKSCCCAREAKRRLLKGEEIRAKQRARVAANPEANRRRVKQWVADNPDRRRRNALAYALRNLDKIRKWTHENPLRLREGRRRRQAIRKARIKGSGGTVTRSDWLSLVAAALPE